ncbi:MAG: type II secretion system minor pseudopilin GspJ [Pseudomonadota bacterium]
MRVPILNKQRQAGFTLIEIVVVVGLLAIVTALAWTAISQAGRNRVKLEARFEQLQEIQIAMQVITRDLAQIQPRPVRDLVGQGQLAAVMTAESEGGIEMTVGGYSNTLNLKRSQQQRVAYQIEDDTLYRSHWLVLDRTQGSVPVRRELIEGILSMNVRFMTRQLEWTESWPLSRDGAGLQDLPVAIEVTLESETMGIVRRIIEVAS